MTRMRTSSSAKVTEVPSRASNRPLQLASVFHLAPPCGLSPMRVFPSMGAGHNIYSPGGPGDGAWMGRQWGGRGINPLQCKYLFACFVGVATMMPQVIMTCASTT